MRVTSDTLLQSIFIRSAGDRNYINIFLINFTSVYYLSIIYRFPPLLEMNNRLISSKSLINGRARSGSFDRGEISGPFRKLETQISRISGKDTSVRVDPLSRRTFTISGCRNIVGARDHSPDVSLNPGYTERRDRIDETRARARLSEFRRHSASERVNIPERNRPSGVLRSDVVSPIRRDSKLAQSRRSCRLSIRRDPAARPIQRTYSKARFSER